LSDIGMLLLDARAAGQRLSWPSNAIDPVSIGWQRCKMKMLIARLQSQPAAAGNPAPPMQAAKIAFLRNNALICQSAPTRLAISKRIGERTVVRGCT